ncbi:MAG: hypothetical protein COA36_13225 [Desulfotalea sp.]|nr:MAG: hypothetical protein COA36_13225 [Desulfotalea sp.]
MTTYTYDPAGNLILHTDSNGNSISSCYDELNRLQSIHYPDASQDTSFTYDQGTNGTGKLISETHGTGPPLRDYLYLNNAPPPSG